MLGEDPPSLKAIFCMHRSSTRLWCGVSFCRGEAIRSLPGVPRVSVAGRETTHDHTIFEASSFFSVCVFIKPRRVFCPLAEVFSPVWPAARRSIESRDTIASVHGEIEENKKKTIKNTLIAIRCDFRLNISEIEDRVLIMLTTMCGTVEAMRLRDALEIDSIRQQWQLRAVTGFNFVDSFIRRHRGIVVIGRVRSSRAGCLVRNLGGLREKERF